MVWGYGVRREGREFEEGGESASCDYSSCNWSGRRSEVEGGTEVKNREGWVTWDSDLNLRDPAGKYYTDPCVYTETLRFTACINTPHTVLYMVVSLLNSCMCISGSAYRYDKTDKVREKSTERKKNRPRDRERQRVWTIWDLSTVNHSNSSLWKFP